MRLKPVLASIILLGISGSAFAATNSNVNVQNQLNGMQSQINSMEQVINQNNGMTQTMGGTALQQRIAACPNWYDSISVSGLINVDAVLSDGDLNYSNRSDSDLTLSNADLFVDAQVNNWTKAHIGLNYQTNNNTSLNNFRSIPADQSLIIKPQASDFIDEAYVTFANFCENPFFLRVGKQYVNFGNYDRFATVPSFTQLLTETNETAATLGFVSNGFYGSVYTFRGLTSRRDTGNGVININDFGGNLGWSMQGQDAKLNLQASYLNNMADTDYIGGGFAANGIPLAITGYSHPVNGVSVDATGSIGMFDGFVHVVSALNDFSNADAPSTPPGNDGATPGALDVGAGLTFNIMDHKSRVGADYQYSWDARNIGLIGVGIPRQRIEGTFDVNVSRNVVVGLDVFNDDDYDRDDGGTGRNKTTGVLHLGVMFA
ncbi:MAG TPA: LbtU family siderophore porin [Gammaproteobacteria bacterium]|nr:LbtU family siderophore porin [Gammaproteobacteria bacterium]